MSKVDNTRIAAIKALFETGDTLTEQNFANLIDAIQEAAQEHEHVPGGGPGSGTGNAAPIQDATETEKGIVELATVAEAQAGTDTTRAVTPAGLLMRKAGTAIIGGDLTGNDRGDNALDIQSGRTAADQVASGSNAVAIGHQNTASGDYSNAFGRENQATGTKSIAAGYVNTASGYYSTAVGHSNTASGYYSTASGYGNTASGYYSTALGCGNVASGDRSTAIGYGSMATAADSMALGKSARARVEKTTNICGPQIIKKDDGEAPQFAFENYCGVEVILMSKEVDLKVVADQTITLPTGCKFWLNEIGIIATQIDGLTTQPTIRFGITGDLDKHRTATQTTNLTATGKRDRYDPLVPEDGETSLTAGVTSAAAGTTVKGRFYWKGMLVEDE